MHTGPPARPPPPLPCSPLTSATKRFAATLGELTGGRVGLTCASGECPSGLLGAGGGRPARALLASCTLEPWRGAACFPLNPTPPPTLSAAASPAAAVGVLKGAVTIAVRYSAQRQQFGPPDAPEVSVLDYPTQQQRLMPMLATAYALHFTRQALVDR